MLDTVIENRDSNRTIVILADGHGSRFNEILMEYYIEETVYSLSPRHISCYPETRPVK